MWFDVTAALAEIAGRPPATLATSATPARFVAGVADVAGWQARKREPADRAAPDIVHDPFDERAAVREFDGGLSREDAEALAAEDAARAPSPPVDQLRAAAMPETPALDPEGLPFAACSACGGGE